MSSSQPRQQEKDFTAEVTALVKEAEKLGKDGQLQQALDNIALLEKQTRNAADLTSTSTLLKLAIRLCYTSPPSPSFPLLHTTLQSYSKKHGQLKEAVVRMVDLSMSWLGGMPDYAALAKVEAEKKKKADGEGKKGKAGVEKGKGKDDAMKVDGEEEVKEEKVEAEEMKVDGQTESGEKTLEEGGDDWLELLNVLRDITEGKIYLELQRARLTKLLSSHHENLSTSAPLTNPNSPSTSSTAIAPTPSTASKPATKGPTTLAGLEALEEEERRKKAERPKPVTRKEHQDVAADLMTEIQVETYSSMDRREKIEFILDQMRLESQRDQWARVRVGGRKVSRAYLKEKGNSDLKLRYYDLIIQLAMQEDAYLDACKAYQEVWDTEEVKEDEAKNQEAIENIIIFIVLSPYDNEQSDMIQKLYANTALRQAVLHFDLLKCFITKELMRWPGIQDLYASTLRRSHVFAAGPSSEKGEDAGSKRWEALHKRVIEHNIRVIASYYTLITLARFTELLDLTPQQAEKTLAAMVSDKVVHAKIDRPAGVINFEKKRNVEAVLNEWSADLGKMLHLIEKTGHLINKEYAIHAARAAA